MASPMSRTAGSSARTPASASSNRLTMHDGLVNKALHNIATHSGADVVSLRWLKEFFGEEAWNRMRKRSAAEQAR